MLRGPEKRKRREENKGTEKKGKSRGQARADGSKGSKQPLAWTRARGRGRQLGEGHMHIASDLFAERVCPPLAMTDTG